MPSSEEASQPGQQDDSAVAALMAADRVVFFSDAVVAIAMTLLALALPVPNAASYHEFRLYLGVHYLDYLAFLISFLVIARHWRTHHHYFDGVERLDSRIITLNLLWLLMIVITPFATRVLTGNLVFRLGFSFYALVQVLTGLTLGLMAREIRSDRLPRQQPAGPASDDRDLNLITFVVMFAISIPVSLLTGSKWSYLCWIASPFAARLARRVRKRREASG